jgi:hypothetical protein
VPWLYQYHSWALRTEVDDTVPVWIVELMMVKEKLTFESYRVVTR